MAKRLVVLLIISGCLPSAQERVDRANRLQADYDSFGADGQGWVQACMLRETDQPYNWRWGNCVEEATKLF